MYPRLLFFPLVDESSRMDIRHRGSCGLLTIGSTDCPLLTVKVKGTLDHVTVSGKTIVGAILHCFYDKTHIAVFIGHPNPREVGLWLPASDHCLLTPGDVVLH